MTLGPLRLVCDFTRFGLGACLYLDPDGRTFAEVVILFVVIELDLSPPDDGPDLPDP